MYASCLCAVTIFFVVTTGQDIWGLIHFSKGKEALVECIEDHDLLNNIYFGEDIQVIKVLIDLIAEKFYSNTKSKDDIAHVSQLVDNFRNDRHIPLRAVNQIQWEQLKESLQKALLDCSDNTTTVTVRNSYESSHQVLPHFIDEPPGVSLLLDYILVNWPYLEQRMIHNRPRRAILRRYAEDALKIFECTYAGDIAHNLNDEMRILWKRRARLFFDGRSDLFPYIDHRYSLHYLIPHTQGDNNEFVNRYDSNFIVRDPLLLRSRVDRFVNIYATNFSHEHNENFSIFSLY